MQILKSLTLSPEFSRNKTFTTYFTYPLSYGKEGSKYIIPYRTKPFIGINVRVIRDCQKLRKIQIHQSLQRTGCSCLRTTPMIINIPLIVAADVKSSALPLSYTATWYRVSRILRSFAKHFTHEYREKTTPSQVLMLCNLSSCRV